MDRWFVYDAENGFDTFETEEEAIQVAEASLDEWRGTATAEGEWPEEVEHLCYGEIVGEVEQVSLVTDDGDPACDYKFGLLDRERAWLNALLTAYRQKRAVDGGGGLPRPDGSETPNRIWDAGKHLEADLNIDRLERMLDAAHTHNSACGRGEGE